MLKESGRELSRVWPVADVALCITLFTALAYDNPSGGRIQHSLFPNSRGFFFEYGPLAIAAMALFAGFGWQLILNRHKVYTSLRRVAVTKLLRQFLLADALGAAVLAAMLFTVGVEAPALLPLTLAGGMFIFQAATRIPVIAFLRFTRPSGSNFRRALIIGSGPRARDATETISLHPEWGFEVVGYVDEGGSGFEPAVAVEMVKKLIELPVVLREEAVDEVLVACPRSMIPALDPAVRECALVGVPITFLGDIFGDQLPPPSIGTFGPIRTLSFAPVHHNQAELAIKRGIDVVGGIVGLILAAPVIAIAALLIRIDTPGPIFFRQIRCGLNGRRFEMIKLRTMAEGADRMKGDLMDLNEMDGPVFKIKEDPRITAVGAVLRRFSIDEFPQFWNVLKGDMSLVGPRPPTPDEVVVYEGGTRRRLSMRPGLTCYWQVGGRNDTGFSEWMSLDLLYIDTWSLTNDLLILLRTIPAVLRARGAS